MLVREPDPKTKILDDLDFHLSNGTIRPITLDKSIGDTIDYNAPKDAIIINLVARPSLTDSSEFVPAETLTFFKQHIMYISRREREVAEQTAAQKREWIKTLQEVGGLVN